MSPAGSEGRVPGLSLVSGTLASLVLACGFVTFAAAYWARCDVGIDGSANAVFLVFVVAPALFAMFGLAWAAAHALGRFVFGLAGPKLLLVGVGAVVMLFATVCGLLIRWSAGYGPGC